MVRLNSSKKGRDPVLHPSIDYHLIFEHISEGVLVIDMNRTIIDCNPAAEKILGYKKNEIVEKPLTDFLTDSFISSFHDQFSILVSERKLESKLEIINKDGRILTISYKIVSFQDKNNFTGALLFIHESVEHKPKQTKLVDDKDKFRAAQVLLDSEEKFRLTFEHAKDAIFWADPDTGTIINCNKAAEILLERSKEEIIGLHQYMLHPPEKKAKYIKQFRNHIRQKKGASGEGEIITQSGKIVPVQITASTVKLGNKLIIQGIFHDISNQKQAELVLRESEEKFRNIVKYAPYGIILADENGYICEWNPAMEQIFGLKQKEALNLLVWEFSFDVMPEERKNLEMYEIQKESISELLKKGQDPHQLQIQETIIQRRDHSRRNIQQFPFTIKTDKGYMLGNIVRDITELKKAEQDLWLKEYAIDSSINAITITNLNGVISYVNPTYLRMTGYNEEDMVGKNINEFTTQIELIHEIEDCLDSRGSWIGETILYIKDKSPLHVLLSVSMIKDESGKPVSVLSSFIDITDQKLMEKALKESEEKFRVLADSAMVGLTIIQDNQVKYINDAMAAIVEVSKEEQLELTSSDVLKYIHPEDAPLIREQLTKKQAGIVEGVIPRYQYRILTRTNKLKWLEVFSQTIIYGGKPADFIVNIDITAQKQANIALSESEKRFRKIFADSPLAIELYNEEGKLVDLNKTCMDLYGTVDKSEVLGLSFHKDPNKWKEITTQLKHTKIVRYPDTVDFEDFKARKVYRCTKSGIMHIECFLTAIKPEKTTSPVQYLVKIVDITSQKLTEEALRESEEKFRTLAESSLFGMSIIQEGQIKYINDAFVQMFGYSREEIVNRTIEEIAQRIHPDDREHALIPARRLQNYQEVKLDPYYPLRIFTKTNQLKWVETSTSLINYQDKPALFTTFNDNTERKRAEEALKESEQKFRVIAESSLVGLAIVQDSTIKFINDAFINIFEYPREEILNWTINDLNKVIHPEDIQIIVEQVQSYQDRVKVKQIPRYQVRIVSQTNKTKWVDNYSQIIDYQNKPAFLVAIMDITEMKQREIENLRLLQELKKVNVELRDFAYIVSHDLKAPLRGMAFLADWLVQEYEHQLDEKGKERFSLLIGRVKRMDALIEGILQYSRLGRTRDVKVELDLYQVISEVIEVLNPPPTIKIEIPSELPVLHYEKTRITQVFLNLLDNAIKFMDKPLGLINIRCTDEDAYWQFSVADNGSGIEEKYFAKIFQMFQTLSPRDEKEATGIGLALVKKIIEMNGGKIWVESEVGQGSTFYFTIMKPLLA